MLKIMETNTFGIGLIQL